MEWHTLHPSANGHYKNVSVMGTHNETPLQNRPLTILL